MFAPNILVTNYCNQKCPFCFAKQEMENVKLSREMSVKEYKKIVLILKKDKNIRTIKLLGGEPTLHTHLFDIIDFAIQNGFDLQIFTNGIIDNKKIETLMMYGKKIAYILNVSTPGYQLNQKLRTVVDSNMEILSSKSPITLSVTLDPFFQPEYFLKQVRVGILGVASHIRIGLGNPISGKKNWYSFEQFPRIGTQTVKLIQLARQSGFKGVFHLNCGFTRCMFTNEEYDILKGAVSSIGWSCFGKESTMDISTNLDAFHCFPLANYRRYNIDKKGYLESHRALTKMRLVLWSKLKMKYCVKCPFYGFGQEKCPGPCLAFRMNENANLKQYII